MMGLQPPRGVTWEEVAHSLQLPANRRQNKNMCDVCYYPRRTCAARTVVGSVSLSVTLYFTPPTSVRLTNDTTYLTGNEDQNDRTVFSEKA